MYLFNKKGLFNPLWKFLRLGNSAWDFLGLIFGQGLFWVLIFASIRSVPSLEIRSHINGRRVLVTTAPFLHPPPPPALLISSYIPPVQLEGDAVQEAAHLPQLWKESGKEAESENRIKQNKISSPLSLATLISNLYNHLYKYCNLVRFMYVF